MTTQSSTPVKVFCGELCETNIRDGNTINLLSTDISEISSNVMFGFDNFVKNPEALPSRILDLLQIASYIYCADRLVDRGKRSSVNNDAWARSFEFHIPVLDHDFWTSIKVINAMGEALKFMTGDRNYSFVFNKATRSIFLNENERQLSLFTNEYVTLDEADKTDVMLFSGGLDSLAGAIERLNDSSRKLCLVSHKSNNTVTHTQNKIIDYLWSKYGKRVMKYGFECHNKKIAPSREETQRSRMFLFSAIAFAICNCYNKQHFFVYENGITSINLPKQSDVFNARASRTTHPKTVGLLKTFYKLFDESFDIITPYYNKTKADIMDVFKNYKEESIISSSVSCSSTRSKPQLASHCGCCSQCIDRVFAVYAADLKDFDSTYAEDIIHHIPDSETKQRLYNTLRLAFAETSINRDEFLKRYPDEIIDVVSYWPNNNPDDCLEEVYELFCRFGDSILKASKNIQIKHEDLTIQNDKDSLLAMFSKREYLVSPTLSKVIEIDGILSKAIPITFQREKPMSENDFNDKIQALLSINGMFSREYPVLEFGITSYKPDHAQDRLVIESKYIRNNTSPSVATNGMAADITLIPSERGVMFVVYDPERKIVDDEKFVDSFEKVRQSCYVRIYR